MLFMWIRAISREFESRDNMWTDLDLQFLLLQWGKYEIQLHSRRLFRLLLQIGVLPCVRLHAGNRAINGLEFGQNCRDRPF